MLSLTLTPNGDRHQRTARYGKCGLLSQKAAAKPGWMYITCPVAQPDGEVQVRAEAWCPPPASSQLWTAPLHALPELMIQIFPK